MKTSITAFYRGLVKHPGLGMTLDEVLACSDLRLVTLEGWSHWIFPLRKPSNTHGGPTLSEEEIQEFRRDPVLRRRLLRSLERMLAFSGLALTVADGKPIVTRAATFEGRSAAWLGTYTSHHAHISRMLQSLMLLGFPEVARALLAALAAIHEERPGLVPQRSFEYWRRAVEVEEYWNSST